MKKLLFICLLPLFAFISCETLSRMAGPRTGPPGDWGLGFFNDLDGNPTGEYFIRYRTRPYVSLGTYVRNQRRGDLQIRDFDYSEINGLAFTLVEDYSFAPAVIGPHFFVHATLNDEYRVRVTSNNGRVLIPNSDELVRILSQGGNIDFLVEFSMNTGHFYRYQFTLTIGQFDGALQYMRNRTTESSYV